MEHAIDPATLQPKGAVRLEAGGDTLRFTTARRIPSDFYRENLQVHDLVELPGVYRLPLRIGFSVRIDEPGFYVLVGDGHVNFGTPWSDNRRMDDIVEPRRDTFFFHNHMPMGRFVDIAIVYDPKAMQILIDGEERYFSTKERYMKSREFAARNAGGFTIALASDKGVHAEVRRLTVTEYEGVTPIEHGTPASRGAIKGNEAVLPGGKPTFEACIARLPEALRHQVETMDAFLRGMKPMKFRRQIEPHGSKITYVAADEGLSYALLPSNDVLTHRLEWYIVANGPTDTWGRKADRMEQTLRAIAQSDPALAQRLFDNLWECVGCYPDDHCLVRTRYELSGQAKIACHGRMRFAMNAGGFEDARAFLQAVNGLEDRE